MKQIPKETNGGLLHMCVKTDQAIKYYQDATIGNEKQVDIVISLTLTPADSITKKRNHKHHYPIKETQGVQTLVRRHS